MLTGQTEHKGFEKRRHRKIFRHKRGEGTRVFRKWRRELRRNMHKNRKSAVGLVTRLLSALEKNYSSVIGYT